MALNSKYNTLYSLFLKLQNNMVTQDLSGVLTAGNTADNDIILNDGTYLNTISSFGIDIFSFGTSLMIDVANGFQYSKPYLLPVPYTLSSSLSDAQLTFTDANANSTYFNSNELKIDNGISSSSLTNSDITIDNGTTSVFLSTTELSFNGDLKGIYSNGTELQILCPNILDISSNGLSLNGVESDYGNVLISGGAGQPAEFEQLTNLICHGSIVTPNLTGTVLFSTFGATFLYIPTVILTVDSGTTTLYVANIVSVNNLQFVYQVSAMGASILNFIAL